jgi:hypothetical protein
MVDIAGENDLARMAELADAPDSKSGSFTRVGVRPSLRAPLNVLGSIENEKKWKKPCKHLSEISGMLLKDLKARIDLTGATALTIVGALDHEIKSYI